MTSPENREPHTWDLGDSERPPEEEERGENLDVEQVVRKVADSMRDSQGRGTPAPEGFEKWATEYFKSPASGEVAFEAPIHFTEENPQAAIEWYEANIGSLPEEEKEILLKTQR